MREMATGIHSCASRYQRAFIDFFEDQLVNRKYDLKALLEDFLLGGQEPLINSLVSGRKYTPLLLRRKWLTIHSCTSPHPFRLCIRAAIQDSGN